MKPTLESLHPCDCCGHRPQDTNDLRKRIAVLEAEHAALAQAAQALMDALGARSFYDYETQTKMSALRARLPQDGGQG